MEERIVVTGMAVITPLGNEIDKVWQQLCAGRSAVKEYEDLKTDGFRFAKACRVDMMTGEKRGYEMAMQCIREAIDQAGVNLPGDAALFLGSTIGESAVFEAAATDDSIDPGADNVYAWGKRLQQALKTDGPVMAFGTACAAGNYAIGNAADYLRNSDATVAIAGGAEPFSRIAMAGFSRSRAMTSDYSKPFDKNRNGMILGEGAAFFILEKETQALQRGAVPVAVIGSLGLTCDAYHATAPLPDGSGMRQAMQQALTLQGLQPQEINWICAHGSGTLASDGAEANAIVQLFGDYKVPVAGYKGALGHSLGAATAVEAALCIRSIQMQEIAPTVNCNEPEPAFSLDMVFGQPRPHRIHHVLNCGYAFGGINSALIISKYQS